MQLIAVLPVHKLCPSQGLEHPGAGPHVSSSLSGITASVHKLGASIWKSVFTRLLLLYSCFLPFSALAAHARGSGVLPRCGGTGGWLWSLSRDWGLGMRFGNLAREGKTEALKCKTGRSSSSLCGGLNPFFFLVVTVEYRLYQQACVRCACSTATVLSWVTTLPLVVL